MKTRIIEVDGVVNFRDLGGYVSREGGRVRYERLYRSAQFDRVTEQGQATLRSKQIGLVVDLRYDDEIDRYSTPKSAFPNAKFVSWQSEHPADPDTPNSLEKRSWRRYLELGDADGVREAMRLNYPKKLISHRGVYRRLLRHLIDSEQALLFHCAAGKDRTGVAAAIILGLLGVNDETIIEDYLVSQAEVSRLLDAWVIGGVRENKDDDDFQRKLMSYPREVVQPVFDADQAYIETLLEHIKQEYGDFSSYADRVLTISRTEIARLKDKLLV